MFIEGKTVESNARGLARPRSDHQERETRDSITVGQDITGACDMRRHRARASAKNGGE